jgi:hypothetical protein
LPFKYQEPSPFFCKRAVIICGEARVTGSNPSSRRNGFNSSGSMGRQYTHKGVCFPKMPHSLAAVQSFAATATLTPLKEYRPGIYPDKSSINLPQSRLSRILSQYKGKSGTVPTGLYYFNYHTFLATIFTEPGFIAFYSCSSSNVL